MKKQFFYAAMAIAFMASCTSDDTVAVDPVNPTPEEDKVALELGVATPAMTVGSRGTGMVGFVDEGGDNSSKISWDSQKLFITMVDQTNNEVYEEPDGTSYFDGLEFRAPSKADGNNNEKIRMYVGNTYGVTEEDKGTLAYKYYPVTGEYTFYGWHIDDATGTIETEFGKTTGTDGNEVKQAIVSGIVIDGSQDLLAAKTVEIPTEVGNANTNPYFDAATKAENAGTYNTMVQKQFSARTARNEFVPILNFEHTLARLQFYVKAGTGTDAALNYKDENGTEQNRNNGYGIKNDANSADDNDDSTYDNWDGTDEEFTKWGKYLNGAIYVTDVKVIGVYNTVSLDLINQKAIHSGSISTEGFPLKSTSAQINEANGAEEDDENYLTTKTLGNLIPVAPKYTADHSQLSTEPASLIGESIMFLPVNNPDATTKEATWGTDKLVKIQVTLGQCLIKTEDETKQNTDPTKYTYYWDTPKPVILTLKASEIVKDNNKLGDDGVFEAGKSYNVYITIYGREQIEVSANLVPWEEGGDINTDIEDGTQVTE